MASAGPYASLHLTPDRQSCQHPTTQLFTARMPFLPPNQQRQSTEGYISYCTAVNVSNKVNLAESKNYSHKPHSNMHLGMQGQQNWLPYVRFHKLTWFILKQIKFDLILPTERTQHKLLTVFSSLIHQHLMATNTPRIFEEILKRISKN